jgi:hypothetical protein
MICVERFRKAYKHSKARKFELKISGFALYDHSAALLLTLNAVEKETIVNKRKRRLVEREGQINQIVRAPSPEPNVAIEADAFWVQKSSRNP